MCGEQKVHIGDQVTSGYCFVYSSLYCSGCHSLQITLLIICQNVRITHILFSTHKKIKSIHPKVFIHLLIHTPILLEGLALSSRRVVMWPLLMPTAIPDLDATIVCMMKEGGSKKIQWRFDFFTLSLYSAPGSALFAGLSEKKIVAAVKKKSREGPDFGRVGQLSKLHFAEGSNEIKEFVWN